jgi:hypothetical protein
MITLAVFCILGSVLLLPEWKNCFLMPAVNTLLNGQNYADVGSGRKN